MKLNPSRTSRMIVAVAALTAVLSLVLAAAVPARLTDEQFWSLSKDSSEEDGVFRSDNLLSNETTYQNLIPALIGTAKPGRVYMGVGPEQNFTYIAALKPVMAFIIDIRHGNLDVHLLYKAVFELSTDRADFVARLFSRKRPNGIGTQSSVKEIFNAIQNAEGSRDLYDANLKAVEDRLINTHHFPLSPGDREGIAWALSNYYRYGPSISYGSSLSESTAPAIVGASGGGVRGNAFPTYANLMWADDGQGHYRGFLASEENFSIIKDLETRNMIVPIVGDFGGPKAIRAVGKYLKSVDATVSAFYVSNVEQFLVQGGIWDTFCESVATLPLDETSMFIRSGRGGPNTVNSSGTGVQNSSAARILPEIASCRLSGR